MKKPEAGTILLKVSDPKVVFLVVDQEPRNWKGSITVKEILQGGGLGAARIFEQNDLDEHITFEQFKWLMTTGRIPFAKAA